MDEKEMSGAVDLRPAFQALREFVEMIPAVKLDMTRINGDCCCVYGHAWSSDSEVLRPVSHTISSDEFNWLYEDSDIVGNFTYPEPKGQPAKDEFLRRLSVLEEKYCGPVAQATNSPSVTTEPEAHSNA